MKKLIIKFLNKIIDSIREDIDKQEDNTNIDIKEFLNEIKNHGEVINYK